MEWEVEDLNSLTPRARLLCGTRLSELFAQKNGPCAWIASIFSITARLTDNSVK